MKKIILFIKVIQFLFWFAMREEKRKLAEKLEKSGEHDKAMAIVHDMAKQWGQYVISLTGKDTVVNVHNSEKVPRNRAVVFYANHQSYFDVIAMLGYFDMPVAFISKIEIRRIPFIGKWMELLGCVFLVRKNPKQSIAAMSKAVENVKKGYSMGIFPEGTRSKTCKLAEFKPGSFKLAFRAEAPIVPVSFSGTRALLEKDGVKSGTVDITFHDPIETKNLSKEEQRLIPEKVRQIVLSALPAECQD